MQELWGNNLVWCKTRKGKEQLETGCQKRDYFQVQYCNSFAGNESCHIVWKLMLKEHCFCCRALPKDTLTAILSLFKLIVAYAGCRQMEVPMLYVSWVDQCSRPTTGGSCREVDRNIWLGPNADVHLLDMNAYLPTHISSPSSPFFGIFAFLSACRILLYISSIWICVFVNRALYLFLII